MRKSAGSILLFLSLILALVHSGHSQTQQAPRFHIGAFAGVNGTDFPNSTIGFHDHSVSRPLAGWSVGPMATVEINRWIDLLVQLAAVGERTITEENFGNDNATINWRRNWLEASTTVRYFPLRGDLVEGFAGMGFATRYLLLNEASATASWDSGPYDFVISYWQAGESEHVWNFFVPVQVGAHFNFESGHRLTLLLEYHAPLRDLYDVDSRYNRFTSYGAKIAYLFPIRRAKNQ